MEAHEYRALRRQAVRAQRSRGGCAAQRARPPRRRRPLARRQARLLHLGFHSSSSLLASRSRLRSTSSSTAPPTRAPRVPSTCTLELLVRTSIRRSSCLARRAARRATPARSLVVACTAAGLRWPTSSLSSRTGTCRRRPTGCTRWMWCMACWTAGHGAS
jgi:hypothetical protein